MWAGDTKVRTEQADYKEGPLRCIGKTDRNRARTVHQKQADWRGYTVRRQQKNWVKAGLSTDVRAAARRVVSGQTVSVRKTKTDRC